MRAIRKLNRVFASVNYIGNFLNRPLAIGDVVQWDDGNHLLMGNLTDLIPGFSWTGKLAESTASNFKLTSESAVNVVLGGSANAPIGKAEVELSFGAKNSAFVSMNDVKTSAVKLAVVSNDLKDLWHSRGWDKAGKRGKFYFLNEVKVAGSCTVIFSQERSNKVVLKAENDAPVTSVQAVGSGRFEYVSNSKATLEIISPSLTSALYQAVSLRANGLFEIVDR
jgi:hypothetical protein